MTKWPSIFSSYYFLKAIIKRSIEVKHVLRFSTCPLIIASILSTCDVVYSILVQFLIFCCSATVHVVVNESEKYCRIAGKLVTICHKKVAPSFNKFVCCFSRSLFSFSRLSFFLDGYSDIEARLVVRKYIEKGSSVTLYCEHNVDPKILYKVSIPTMVSLQMYSFPTGKTRKMLERI